MVATKAGVGDSSQATEAAQEAEEGVMAEAGSQEEGAEEEDMEVRILNHLLQKIG